MQHTRDFTLPSLIRYRDNGPGLREGSGGGYRRRSCAHYSVEEPGEVRGASIGTGSRLVRTPASDDVADFPGLGKAGLANKKGSAVADACVAARAA